MIWNNRTISLTFSHLLFILPLFLMCKNTSTTNEQPNRLIHEKSPYLLQHADNPVDWYPWGEEAFQKALAEDKPIFLSIGYSTCHWCHVMEHESFEDPEVSRLMNETFISIKVDREERPDIDNIYMTVCQMMTGSGGWPLTIIMTPDKKPFFAGTYIPKDDRFGRMGMLQLIPRIQELWLHQRDELLQSADQITASLQSATTPIAGEALDASVLHQTFNKLQQQFDAQRGGFGNDRKFPSPHNLLFLLRYWNRTNSEDALTMVEKTLDGMRDGGIYDHIGYGFHRYSTDPDWKVPHFEKMLYDQAMIAMAYTEAYQATRKQRYAETVREIFTYVLRDMTDSSGGFYSAEDADSEGEEGKFYVWDAKEINSLIDGAAADLFNSVYTVSPEGNFIDEATGERPGTNILYRSKALQDIISEMNITEESSLEILENARDILFTAREKRIHPHKDDKILTDWNGLMIAALSKAGRVLDKPEYIRAAEKTVSFINANMIDSDGKLLHRYREGSAAINGNVDDYAFMIWGLLELYEATFNAQYIKTALTLQDYLTEHFWDETGGGFYFTADNAEKLLIRQKEIYDGAIPSGNSVAMQNLLRLGRITSQPELENMAAQIGRTFSSQVTKAPLGYTHLMSAVDFGVGPSYEIVIAGEINAQDTNILLTAIRMQYMPNKVVLVRPAKDAPIVALSPFTKNQNMIDGKATVYVCQNYACNLPTTDVAELIAQLVSK